MSRKRVHWDDDIQQIPFREEIYAPSSYQPPSHPRRDGKSGDPVPRASGRLQRTPSAPASSTHVATTPWPYVSPVSGSHHNTAPPVASSSSSSSSAQRLRHSSPYTSLRTLYFTSTQKRPSTPANSYSHSHSSSQTSWTPYEDWSVAIHRTLRLGACEPVDFFSPKRVKPHASVASEFASHPPLPRILMFVEIENNAFNIEVRARDGVGVTVEDVLVRAQSVLRALLPPETLGGYYRQKCSCGIDVDRVSAFTTLFLGLSVGGGGMYREDPTVWRMHLKRVRAV
ncbi:hypothetical protein DFS33DRAFT_1275300 [Desarmillaria ectypa]|nr:hypothetical protein DFS33DRAFT_1275300 [Desarmillaria ectypa]